MKKLALAILLTCLSLTGALAQGAPDYAVSTSASASAPAAELPTLQDVTSVAHKAGALVGGLFHGTFKVGSALFSGVKAGVTGAVPAEASTERAQPSNDSPSFVGLSGLFKATNHVPAPVEDRSTYSAALVL